MTLQATPRAAGPFLGGFGATSFPFAFKTFATSDIRVTVTDVNGVTSTLISNYRVVLNPDQDTAPGGVVYYPVVGSSLATGETLRFYSQLSVVQLTDIKNAGRFLPQVIETAFDYLTALFQESTGAVSRAVRAPSPELLQDMPAAAARANRALVFDSLGQPGASAFTITNGIPAYTPLVNYFQGTGLQTVFVLTTAPGLPENCQVYIGALKQKASSYTVAGTSLTFDAPPPADATDPFNIEVVIGTAVQSGQPLITFNNGGTSLGSSVTSVKTAGILTASRLGNEITLTVPATAAAQAPITLKDEGLAIGGAGSFNTLNFVGANLAVTDAGSGVANITVSAAGAATNANAVTYNPAITGFVSRTVESRLKDRVSVKDFGAKGDAVTDDKAAIQLAINYAASIGAQVYFPSGTYIVSGALNITFSGAATDFSPKAAILGDGPSQTRIAAGPGNFNVFNVTNPNTYGDALTHAHLTIEGLYIVKNDLLGICINATRIAYFTMRDVHTLQGNYGIYGTDVLSSNFYNCSFGFGNQGARFERGGGGAGSGPNALAFFGCRIGGNYNYGIWFVGAGVASIYGGSIEGNGQSAGASGFGVLCSNAGFEAGVGLNVDGVYFEGNQGVADVWVTGTTNGAAANKVSGCTFNRSAASPTLVTNCIMVEGSGATTKLGMTVIGCGFKSYNGYVANAARRYINSAASSGATVTVAWDGACIFEDAVEVPAITNAMGGGGGGGSDTNSMFAYATCDPSGGVSASAGAKNVGSVIRTGVGAYTFNLAVGTGTIPPTYNVTTVWPYVCGVTSISPNFVTVQAGTLAGAPADISICMQAAFN